MKARRFRHKIGLGHSILWRYKSRDILAKPILQLPLSLLLPFPPLSISTTDSSDSKAIRLDI